jgi:predicted enzyme related to lactoylglutathione lyase
MTRPEAMPTPVSVPAPATPHPLAVSAIVVEAEAPLALAAFWSQAFGVPVAPGSTAAGASLMTSPRIPLLAFERSDHPEGRTGGITLRSYTEDLDAHVARLVALGASVSRPRRAVGGRDVAELRDPEGNRLVLVQL